MVLWKLLVAFITCSYTFVLPPVTDKRPNTGRLSRGPVWTSFKDLKLEKAILATSHDSVSKHKRIAVVSNEPDGVIGELTVYSMLLTNGLNYVPNTIVTDFVTSRQLFADCKTLATCLDIAKNSQIDHVVWCSLEDQLFKTRVYDVSTQSEQAPMEVIDWKSGWLEKVASSRSELQRRFDPNGLRAAITHSPVSYREISALILWAKAAVQISSLATVTESGKQQEICRAALAMVDEAIVKDPNLIEAYILKASCQDELEDNAGVKQTLSEAFSRRDPSLLDRLTSLELEADYARFCKNDIDTAIDKYSEMIEINPTNLRANWGLIDIILTGNGLDRPAEDDLVEASRLAAEIVTHHPQTGVARAIESHISGTN